VTIFLLEQTEMIIKEVAARSFLHRPRKVCRFPSRGKMQKNEDSLKATGERSTQAKSGAILACVPSFLVAPSRFSFGRRAAGLDKESIYWT